MFGNVVICAVVAVAVVVVGVVCHREGRAEGRDEERRRRQQRTPDLALLSRIVNAAVTFRRAWLWNNACDDALTDGFGRQIGERVRRELIARNADAECAFREVWDELDQAVDDLLGSYGDPAELLDVVDGPTAEEILRTAADAPPSSLHAPPSAKEIPDADP